MKKVSVIVLIILLTCFTSCRKKGKITESNNTAFAEVRGLSQDKLAEKADISRSLVSSIEAPGIANNFSLETFYNICDALEVEPEDLIKASVFPDKLIKKK